jgi:7-cyano-7-deazaguanine synthase
VVGSLPDGVCVLTSGGLDSAVLVATLARRHRVHPLYVRSGLAWERAERALLARFLAALRRSGARVAPLAEAGLPVAALYGRRHWSISGQGVPGTRAAFSANYLPGRNLLLVSIAAVYCARAGVGRIALALLRDNPFRDATPRFLRDVGRVASRALGRRLVVRAPFRTLSKAEVVRRGRGLALELTLSCARPRGLRHCGRCTKCAERHAAFARAGVPDPTDYLRTGRRPARAASGTAARPRGTSARGRRRRAR